MGRVETLVPPAPDAFRGSAENCRWCESGFVSRFVSSFVSMFVSLFVSQFVSKITGYKGRYKALSCAHAHPRIMSNTCSRWVAHMFEMG